ncbi:MAG TPA: hypothetical protein VKF38_12055, partial [Anaerolineaceae bacterium]|nr:hypothetical protein [Anaerolineaceae bacterium]
VTYLNVAAAMNRTGLSAQALDAITGQPLAGASITASLQSGATFVLKDTSLVPANGAAAMLINLPFAVSGATNYQLSINKTGYTTGAQPFDLVNLDPIKQNGTLYTDPYSTVGVPPSSNLNLVLNWNDPNNVHPNLDLYLWLPNHENGGQGGIIGHNTVPVNLANGSTDLTGILSLTAPFLAAGTLLPATAWGGTFSPYAIHNFNGEIQVIPTTPPAQPVYYPPMESISILGDPTSKPTAKAPMLKPFYDKTSGEYYSVIVNDNTAGGYLTSITKDIHGNPNPDFIAPILRVWAKGYLVPLPQPTPGALGSANYYGVQLVNGSGCDGNTNWWKVLDISAANIYITPTITTPNENTCGDGDSSLIPYGVP